MSVLLQAQIGESYQMQQQQQPGLILSNDPSIRMQQLQQRPEIISTVPMMQVCCYPTGALLTSSSIISGHLCLVCFICPGMAGLYQSKRAASGGWGCTLSPGPASHKYPHSRPSLFLIVYDDSESVSEEDLDSGSRFWRNCSY